MWTSISPEANHLLHIFLQHLTLYFDWCHWKLLREAKLIAALSQHATPRRALPPVAVLCVVAMMDRLLQHCKQLLYRCNWKQRGKFMAQVPTADGSRNRERKRQGDWYRRYQGKREKSHQSFFFSDSQWDFRNINTACSHNQNMRWDEVNSCSWCNKNSTAEIQKDPRQCSKLEIRFCFKWNVWQK